MANPYNNFGVSNTPIGTPNTAYSSFGIVNSNMNGLPTIYNTVTDSVSPQSLSSGYITNDIQSANFATGVSGWRIRVNGQAEFQSLTGLSLSGVTINGASIIGGTISGTTITGGTFKTNSSLPSSGSGIIIDGSGGTFTVYNSGNTTLQISPTTISFATLLGVSTAQFSSVSSNLFQIAIAGSSTTYDLNTSYFGPSLNNPDLGTNDALTWNNVYSKHALVIPSDLRLKKNVKYIKSGVDEVCKLKPVFYSLKGDDQISMGLIAQDVKESDLPEEIKNSMVLTRKDGMYSMEYNAIIPLLINAVKDLKTQVDNLSRQIKESVI